MEILGLDLGLGLGIGFGLGLAMARTITTRSNYKRQDQTIELSNLESIIEFISYADDRFTQGKPLSVVIMGASSFSLYKLKRKYWALLKEKQFTGEGLSVDQLHTRLKGKYLVGVILRHHEYLKNKAELSRVDAERLVRLESYVSKLSGEDVRSAITEILGNMGFVVDEVEIQRQVEKVVSSKAHLDTMLTLADGGVVDYLIMQDYYEAVEHHFMIMESGY